MERWKKSKTLILNFSVSKGCLLIIWFFFRQSNWLWVHLFTFMGKIDEISWVDLIHWTGSLPWMRKKHKKRKRNEGIKLKMILLVCYSVGINDDFGGNKRSIDLTESSWWWIDEQCKIGIYLEGKIEWKYWKKWFSTI